MSSSAARRGVSARLVDVLVPRVGALLIRTVRAWVRLRVHGREGIEGYVASGQRYVHVFWHAHLLLMVYSYIGPQLLFMISQHRDGELIASTVERFGYKAARGSSTRGGAAALRGMLRALRSGEDIGFTPDGPRGPARIVQPGCVVAARAGGVPIVPVAIGVDRAWRLSSWDRFMVPKPLSRALIAYGEPLMVSRDESIESGCARVQRALRELEDFARDNAGDPAVGRSV